MAKRRKTHQRPANQPRRPPPRDPASEEKRNAPLFNLRPEPLTDERREVLAQLPAWARTLRVRSGLVVGIAVVAAVIAYNAGGRVAGPAVAGLLMVGAGLALWRADKLESRAREQMETGS